MTSFSLEHNYKEDGCYHSLEKWKTQYLSFDEVKNLGINANPRLFRDGEGNDVELSIYDIIRYHLGYQLVISDFSQSNGEIAFRLTNYGFAPPLNFNYLAIAIKNTATGEIIEKEIMDYDKAMLQSGASIMFKTVTPNGYTAVGIKADTFKGRGINPRFANSTPFVDGIQYFK